VSGLQKGKSAGWTLIELICVLAISSILLLLSLDSGWSDVRQSQRLDLYIQALLNDLQTARLLASNIRQDSSLQAVAAGWQNGWAITLNDKPQLTETMQVAAKVSWKAGIKSNAGPIFLSGGGDVQSPGSFIITDRLGRVHKIIVSKSGRARLDQS
jgi:prepilin-type N-terminal cleavage/methylation domain-containing protein